ncbi:MAG: hypothetical protein WA746_21640, partial [Isosphaeraceae bacterium]
RVAGSQISHIFRRASAGSEALPSLARRVSMQQHAELTCRGNIDRAGKVATPERNLAGKHSFHLVYLPFYRAPTGERQEIFGVHAELGAMFADEPAYFAQ